MELFRDGKLDPAVFENSIRQGMHDLNDLLAIAMGAQSPAVEPAHFLIALAKIPGGEMQRALSRRGLSVENWETGLSRTAEKAQNALIPPHLVPEALHANTHSMLKKAKSLCEEGNLAQISEPVLMLAALLNLSPQAKKLFKSSRIDLEDWCRETEALLKPIVPIIPFSGAPEQPLDMKIFTGGARKLLKLMATEAESLGYSQIDPRHMLLALVEREKGVAQYGLFHQGVSPRRVQEAVSISLRGGALKTHSSTPLDQEHMQPLLLRMLIIAGELAGRDRSERIAERHLLRAFLSVESSARRILQDEKVDIDDLRKTVEEYDSSEEDKEEDAMADIQTVKERLQRRLVGQDEAIEQILPYVQRMRFGFTTPGRPIGTFLFCGQSGSGKTEMAKELARAIYGSEENLIFLEMGQFNSPESMNIFVGAPPGYIGYGEGKLTNGLRDKPQSVVLFDEVEKAHPKVLDALLRFLDEGRIDDPAGPVRDGSQCILILTSNLGAEELSKLRTALENDPNKQTKIRKALREAFKKANFRVEFLNRIEELFLFRTLNEKDYVEIARRLLQRDVERLGKERQIHIASYDGIPEAIGKHCNQIAEGARAAHRLTQKIVITPVIDFVLKHSLAVPVKLIVEPVWGGGDIDAEPASAVKQA